MSPPPSTFPFFHPNKYFNFNTKLFLFNFNYFNSYSKCSLPILNITPIFSNFQFFLQMEKITYAYVICIEFAFSLLLHTITVVKMWQILKKFIDKKFFTEMCPKVSIFLIFLLIGWLLTSLSYIPKEIYILCVWRPVENLRNGNLIFWSFMPSLCQYSTVPVFVLFLTLDRIFIIQYNARYQSNLAARRILLFSLLALVSTLWMTNFIQFLNRWPDIQAKTDCWTFTCLVGDGGMNFYLFSRIAIAIPNCIGALVFLWILCRMNNNRQLAQNENQNNLMQNRLRARANRYNNLITLWAICSEFLLNFVPYFVPLIIQMAKCAPLPLNLFIMRLIKNGGWQFPEKELTKHLICPFLTGINIVANVGVFASMLSAVEGLIFVCIYSRVLRRLEKDSVSTSQNNHQTVAQIKRERSVGIINVMAQTTRSSVNLIGLPSPSQAAQMPNIN